MKLLQKSESGVKFYSRVTRLSEQSVAENPQAEAVMDAWGPIPNTHEHEGNFCDV